MITAATRQVKTAVSPVKTFFAWWRNELQDMLPAALHRSDELNTDLLLILFRDRQPDLYRYTDKQWTKLGRLQVDAGSKDFDLLARRDRDAGETIIVRLPAAVGLHRQVELPLAAEHDLHQVLAYQLDSLSPYPPSQIYFSYHIAGRDFGTGKLAVDLYLAPRDQVDRRVKWMEGLGLTPDIVDFCDGEELSTPVMNLLPTGAAAGFGKKRPWMSRFNRLLLIANIGLLVAVFATHLMGKAAEEERLETLVETAKLKADAATKLRKRVEELREENSFLLDRKQETLPTLTVLDELTRILPDGTWLEKARLEPREVSLRGLSSKATTLIREIENSHLFERVTFQAPVVQDDRSGGERFQISAVITTSVDTDD